MEKCKFCQEELAEGSTVCPHCGKDNAPETEKVAPAEEVTEETAAPEEAAAEQTGTERPPPKLPNRLSLPKPPQRRRRYPLQSPPTAIPTT